MKIPRKPEKSKPEYARLIPTKSLRDDLRADSPRLLPLDFKKPTFEDHNRKYLDLADMALKPKNKKSLS